MYSMALLDDRREQRTTLMRSIRDVLPAEWQCIECPLLPKLSSYPQWLTQNDVFVLIADQVLDEQAADSEGAVDYKGHEVINSIRNDFPNFPVFIVTAHRDDDNDLSQHEADAEDVISRRELTEDPEKYVTRMVRAGQRFHEEHERRLSELTELAVKVASGDASNDEREALRKLQVSVGSESAARLDLTRNEALDSADEKLAELEKLRTEIEQLLSKEGKK